MSEFIPRSIESKGKSIDEAIFRGLQEMGVSIDEVTIVTLQEGSKGILGIGAKPFVIRLTTKPVDLSALEEKRKSERAAARSERSRRERGDRPQRTEKPRREERPQQETREETASGEQAEAKPAAEKAKPRQPAYDEEKDLPQAEGQREDREEEHTAPSHRGERSERSRSRSRGRGRERERVIPPDTPAQISSPACSNEWAWIAASALPTLRRR